MGWGRDISEMSFKDTKTLGLLRKNVAFAHMIIKGASYKTLGRSKSQCSTPIWSPNSKPQMNQLDPHLN